VLLALATAGTAAAGTEGSPPPPSIILHGDTVTATLARAPVGSVLKELAKQAGAEVQGEVALEREVTLELREAPVDQALKRLLGTQSFTLTYGRNGRLKRIALGGEPVTTVASQEAPRPASSRDAAADPGTTSGPWQPSDQVKEAVQRVGELLNENPDVPVRGRLADALGTDTLTLKDLWQAALRNENSRVRTEARRAAVKALVADPEVRVAFATSVSSLPDDALVKILRGAGGLDAQELATALARYGRSPALARTMGRALEQMRAQPTPQ
jgi:hypothetical protein